MWDPSWRSDLSYDENKEREKRREREERRYRGEETYVDRMERQHESWLNRDHSDGWYDR